MSKSLAAVPTERVEQAILLIRGERVILDADLAKLYGVSTKRLNEQVKRNCERFPVPSKTAGKGFRLSALADLMFFFAR